MQPGSASEPNTWDEANTQAFLDYGRYFVPERERQIEIITRLTPRTEQPSALIDLCCGEGLLAQALLESFPSYTVFGLDGSPAMLQRARQRLAGFGERFQACACNLFARAWPETGLPVLAVVSSLAIHHLEGRQKLVLFEEVYRLLSPGGAFLIADLIEPTHPQGWAAAAEAWDEAVRQRSRQIDGNDQAFEFFQRERWNTYRYLDPEDIDKPSPLLSQLKWLEQAGFTAVDVFWMLAGHAVFGGWKPMPKMGDKLG
ncbi:MAG: class I SAM-dependent methyltransferase [Rubrivivax sp.]|nr:class I SAM-dependent methyltransferase [Rubrivivax sp.]